MDDVVVVVDDDDDDDDDDMFVDEEEQERTWDFGEGEKGSCRVLEMHFFKYQNTCVTDK
jgi:hypothetical protein